MQPEDHLERNGNIFAVATGPTKNETSTSSTENRNDIYKQHKSTPTNHFECNYSKIESVNDDCLYLIYEFLNIKDIVSVSATCTRLLNFAKAYIFPKKVKQIIIRTGLDELPVTVTFPLDNRFSSKTTQQSLQTEFQLIGECVEELVLELQYSVSPIEKAEIWHSYMIVMEHCKYLRTLHFNYFDFDPNETEALKDRIERFHDLKELKLFRCTGILSNWPAEFTNNSKVEKLALCANTPISRHFFKYFKDMASLSIDFDFCKWQKDDYVMIFDHIGNSLEHLEIIDKDQDCNDYQSIAELITEKILKLKRLTFNGTLTDRSMFIIRLPTLKSLEIVAGYNININLLMRTLSDIGNIEDLTITTGLSDEGTHLTELNFNRLQSLRLTFREENDYHLMEAITRSNMPEIYNFEIRCDDFEEFESLLKFLDSKKTLTTIRLSFAAMELTFLRQIIEVLIKPCMPKRAVITLQIHPFKIGQEEVSKKSTLARIITKYLCLFLDGTA